MNIFQHFQFIYCLLSLHWFHISHSPSGLVHLCRLYWSLSAHISSLQMFLHLDCHWALNVVMFFSWVCSPGCIRPWMGSLVLWGVHLDSPEKGWQVLTRRVIVCDHIDQRKKLQCLPLAVFCLPPGSTKVLSAVGDPVSSVAPVEHLRHHKHLWSLTQIAHHDCAYSLNQQLPLRRQDWSYIHCRPYGYCRPETSSSPRYRRERRQTVFCTKWWTNIDIMST